MSLGSSEADGRVAAQCLKLCSFYWVGRPPFTSAFRLDARAFGSFIFDGRRAAFAPREELPLLSYSAELRDRDSKLTLKGPPMHTRIPILCGIVPFEYGNINRGKKSLLSSVPLSSL